jgi:DNA-binding transcriptional LysR family regulator
MPKHPNDLTTHNALLYQLHDIVHDVWQFSHQNEIIKVKMNSNRAANDAELVRRWCVAGKGVAAKSILDMSHDLLADRVVHLLPDFEPQKTELWLVCPSRQSITPAVRLLRDYLKEQCAQLLTQLIDNGNVKKSVLD